MHAYVVQLTKKVLTQTDNIDAAIDESLQLVFARFTRDVIMLQRAVGTGTSEEVMVAAGMCALDLSILCNRLGLPENTQMVAIDHRDVVVSHEDVVEMLHGMPNSIQGEVQTLAAISSAALRRWMDLVEESMGHEVKNQQMWTAIVAFEVAKGNVHTQFKEDGIDPSEFALEAMRNIVIENQKLAESASKGSN